MYPETVRLLNCPACESAKLSYGAFAESDTEELIHGVVWCIDCRTWYPVEDGLLELLTGTLVYKDERERFVKRYGSDLRTFGLDTNLSSVDIHDMTLELQQQSHSDWYAHNERQSYSDYANTPFWLAVDRLAFEPWRDEIQEDGWLLDVGCAQGRSTFKLIDLDINILGVDISKHLVRQAVHRYRHSDHMARASFVVADANRLPLNNDTMDYILIYGVLHHLPDPQRTCKEIGRILRPGGIYFGSENNTTAFRKAFDILQSTCPMWSEEAGPQPLISKEYLSGGFEGTQIELRTYTSVYLPPQLINLVSQNTAYRLLRFFDRLGRAIPFLKSNGGLLLIHGKNPEVT